MQRKSVSCLISWIAFICAQQFVQAELKEDIVYKKVGDLELKLDIAFPDDAFPGNDKKMRPLMICIHGGGWAGGNKRQYHGQMKQFASNGVVAASVQYRLTDVAPWPAQWEDVAAAHKFLVEHAGEYGIDPERIGATGASAGGHLAMMLGVRPEEKKESLRVRNVINLFGPTDIRDGAKHENVRGLLEALAGGELDDHVDKLADASPLLFVDRTDAPILTFHGSKDDIVPVWHAEVIHKKLNETKIPNQFVKMEGVGHGMGGDMQANMKLIKDHVQHYLVGSDMPLVAHEDFDADTKRWKPTDDMAWKLNQENGRSYFSLVKQSKYKPKVRSPLNIALLDDIVVGDFVLDIDFRSTNEPYGHQDLCLFFGHQDPSHFYYVHFGREADAHANSIFLVNDAARVSIAESRTEGTDWSTGWHRARIKRIVADGKIEVFFDDMQKPVMVATDKTFESGKIGFGSFDDIGDFDSVRLYGQLAN